VDEYGSQSVGSRQSGNDFHSHRISISGGKRPSRDAVRNLAGGTGAGYQKEKGKEVESPPQHSFNRVRGLPLSIGNTVQLPP
jgi:hypothetical protein